MGKMDEEDDMQETKADMLMSLAKCYEELQEYDKTISYCTAII